MQMGLFGKRSRFRDTDSDGKTVEFYGHFLALGKSIAIGS
jgi:hypothetical protein